MLGRDRGIVYQQQLVVRSASAVLVIVGHVTITYTSFSLCTVDCLLSSTNFDPTAISPGIASMADTKTAASLGSPSSPQSSPSSRPASPTRGLRRPASHGRLAKLMLPGRSRSSSSASASNEVVYADDTTPITSGRTTPEQRRRSGKAAASSLLASDAKYKKFAGLVDKSLQSFESVNEWADFISFLSRLLKVSRACFLRMIVHL